MPLEELDRALVAVVDLELELDRVGAEEDEPVGGGVLVSGSVPPCMFTISAASR